MKKEFIKPVKRLLIVIGFGVWGLWIFNVISKGSSFHEEFPSCIIGTMIIFGIIIAIYKNIEEWEENNK